MSRVYLPSTGAGAGSPAFSSAWESTVGADRLAAVLTPIVSAMANKVTAGDGTTGNDCLARQYILGPLAAGCVFTAGQVLKAQVRGREAAATNNQRLAILAWVVASDFTTVRATNLKFSSAPGTEFDAATITNRAISTTLANSYTTVDNDYLVLEIGLNQTAGPVAGNNTLVFGDDSTDLPEDETTTTANNPWVDFPSTTLTLFTATLVGTSTSIRPTRRRRR